MMFSSQDATWTIGVLAAAAMLGFFALRYHPILAKKVAALPGYIGKQVFTITDEGLRIETSEIVATRRWHFFTAVRATDDDLILDGPRNVIPVLIPRRAFSTRAASDAYLAELRARVAKPQAT